MLVGILMYVIRATSISNFGLPRPASILSMVRESKFKISASLSWDSPCMVRASFTAFARAFYNHALQFTSVVVYTEEFGQFE